MTKILVSLTTYKNPDWRETIADLKKFNVKEFAFFLTSMKAKEERMAIMRTIKAELEDVSIPVCHIRQDMDPEELDFMIDNFGTKKFNIHPDSGLSPDHDYSKYMNIIYVENSGSGLINGISEEILKQYAGICLDLSHLENCRKQKAPGYEIDVDLAQRYPIGWNHISAMTEESIYASEINSHSYERHHLEKLNQVDYIKSYYPDYFGEYAAIEMFNSIESQLEIKHYIEKILNL